MSLVEPRRRQDSGPTLGSTYDAEATLFEILARHPRAAFVVAPPDAPWPANERGARILADARDATLEAISCAISNEGCAFDVIAMRAGVLVLVERVPERGERIRIATERWELTRRQSDVLTGLLRGLSNKEIANDLGCAEVTVERHLSAIYRASGFSGRTRLIAGLGVG